MSEQIKEPEPVEQEAKTWWPTWLVWPTWATPENAGIGFGALVVVALLGLMIFRTCWVTNVESYELCYTFDRWAGEIEVVNEQGWVVRNPFTTSVHSIDLRPQQITISANKRVLNAKLVRFEPKGFKTFMDWHGRGAEKDLWEILKCYAFDPEGGKDCPFLEVVQEITPNQAGQAVQKGAKDGGKK